MELNRPEVRNCVNHETALELYRLADSNNVFAESEVQNPVFCLEKVTFFHKCVHNISQAIRNIWRQELAV